jgi:hypothetical protein
MGNARSAGAFYLPLAANAEQQYDLLPKAKKQVSSYRQISY